MVAVDLLTICSSRVGAFLRGGGAFSRGGFSQFKDLRYAIFFFCILAFLDSILLCYKYYKN